MNIFREKCVNIIIYTNITVERFMLQLSFEYHVASGFFVEDLFCLKCYEKFKLHIPNIFGGAFSPSKIPTKTDSVFTVYFSSNWSK
jgi:hypothetical protein